MPTHAARGSQQLVDPSIFWHTCILIRHLASVGIELKGERDGHSGVSRAYHFFDNMVGAPCERDEGRFAVHWLLRFIGSGQRLGNTLFQDYVNHVVEKAVRYPYVTTRPPGDWQQLALPDEKTMQPTTDAGGGKECRQQCRAPRDYDGLG